MEILLTWVTIYMIAAGLVGTVTSALGNTLGAHLAKKPEGERDSAMGRYIYTTYGAFSKRKTLIGSSALLAVGLLDAGLLLFAGWWRLD